jgi:peptidoglycan/LPS O-acetylase OafA/YrhL
MTRRLSPTSTALLASGLIAVLALLPHVPVPVRAVLIVGFALVCPGLAWVRLVHIEDRLAELTLGVALSIAIGTLVASLQAYAGAWSPKGCIVLLALVVVAAAVAEIATSPSSDRQEAR